MSENPSEEPVQQLPDEAPIGLIRLIRGALDAALKHPMQDFRLSEAARRRVELSVRGLARNLGEISGRCLTTSDIADWLEADGEKFKDLMKRRLLSDLFDKIRLTRLQLEGNTEPGILTIDARAQQAREWAVAYREIMAAKKGSDLRSTHIFDFANSMRCISTPDNDWAKMMGDDRVHELNGRILQFFEAITSETTDDEISSMLEAMNLPSRPETSHPCR